MKGTGRKIEGGRGKVREGESERESQKGRVRKGGWKNSSEVER